MSLEEFSEVISELRKAKRWRFEYPKFNNIMSYSQISLYEISFNKEKLSLFNPPLELFGGAAVDKNISLIEGEETYVPRSLGEEESRLSNLMRCIIYYESQVVKRRLNRNIRVITDSGLLQAIATRKKSEYKIASYHGQIFIECADRKSDMPKSIKYSGKRFVKIMTDRITEGSVSHFQFIQEIELGKGFKVLIASKMDSFLTQKRLKELIDPQKFYTKDKVSGNEGYNKNNIIYIEMKSLFCRGFQPEFFKKSANSFLHELKNCKYKFWPYLFKVIIKCVFTNQKAVVFGVRDKSFRQLGIKLISLSTLVLFMRKNKPYYYREYVFSLETVKRELRRIVSTVKDGEVYQFEITQSESNLSILPESQWKEEMDKIVDEQLRDWREKGIFSDEMKNGKSYDRQLDRLVKEGEDEALMEMIESLEKLNQHNVIPLADLQP